MDSIHSIHLFHRWSSARCIVATSAFGAGVDCPDVRTVVHIVGAYDMLAFAQETGRAGRDGRPALCLTISSDPMRKGMRTRQEAPVYGDLDMDQIFRWVGQTDQCRRQLLHTFLDVDAQPCIAFAGGEHCDICQLSLEMQNMSPDMVSSPVQSPAETEAETFSVSVPAMEAHRCSADRDHTIRSAWSLLQEIGDSCAICWAANSKSSRSPFSLHSQSVRAGGPASDQLLPDHERKVPQVHRSASGLPVPGPHHPWNERHMLSVSHPTFLAFYLTLLSGAGCLSWRDCMIKLHAAAGIPPLIACGLWCGPRFVRTALPFRGQLGSFRPRMWTFTVSTSCSHLPDLIIPSEWLFTSPRQDGMTNLLLAFVRFGEEGLRLFSKK